MTIQREFYRRNELVDILHINYKTITNWVKEGYIKEYRINQKSRTPLYNLKEIQETLFKNPSLARI